MSKKLICSGPLSAATVAVLLGLLASGGHALAQSPAFDATRSVYNATTDEVNIYITQTLGGSQLVDGEGTWSAGNGGEYCLDAASDWQKYTTNRYGPSAPPDSWINLPYFVPDNQYYQSSRTPQGAGYSSFFATWYGLSSNFLSPGALFATTYVTRNAPVNFSGVLGFNVGSGQTTHVDFSFGDNPGSTQNDPSELDSNSTATIAAAANQNHYVDFGDVSQTTAYGSLGAGSSVITTWIMPTKIDGYPVSGTFHWKDVWSNPGATSGPTNGVSYFDEPPGGSFQTVGDNWLSLLNPLPTYIDPPGEPGFVIGFSYSAAGTYTVGLSPVPEPSTIALALAAAGCLLAYAWRKRQTT